MHKNYPDQRRPERFEKEKRHEIEGKKKPVLERILPSEQHKDKSCCQTLHSCNYLGDFL
jgi:hypothetical protein